MRLSKKKRIEQHKRVYGKTFAVESHAPNDPGETYLITVRVTKLTQKSNSVRMHFTLSGLMPCRDMMMTYIYRPFELFGYLVWTKFGPAIFVKGGTANALNIIWQPLNINTQIINGCETILVEATILEESNEQETKAQASTSETLETSRES